MTGQVQDVRVLEIMNREGHSHQKWPIRLLLAAYVVLGILYATTTPIFEASDELWHYPFVRHLADGNPLPVQNPQNVGPWKQEASQQPLYYALAAALTFWIDTTDMDSVRWLNPHVDNGILTEDGNTNLVVHRPEAESFPWQGTVLAVRLIRLISVFLGAGTVFFTYHISSLVSPSRPELGLAAAALVAFTPMFLFISGAVNNDNLVMLLAAMALYLMLRIVRSALDSNQQVQDVASPLRSSLILGIVLGLAALTKTSALGLIPLAVLSVLLSWWIKAPRRSDSGILLGHLVVLVLPVILIAGWWYWRNYRLYGDWLGWNAFIAVLGSRAHPASLEQLWGERWGFSLSYWGLFGGVNIPMPSWIYRLLNGLGIAALCCLTISYLSKLWRAWPKLRNRASLAVTIASDFWPIGLLAIWTAGIFVGLVRWATITWSSQGRLVFPAIPAISILLVSGLFEWLPRRLGRWAAALLSLFMFAISVIAPLAWIAPAYQPPPPPTEAQTAALENRLDLDFGDHLRLLGYQLGAESAQPGDLLELTLFWQAIQPMERNWSVFVHLNEPVIGAPIAQRDMYPGQGLLATSLLEPGQQVANKYLIRLPGATYAPSEVDLVVGLYDFYGGERLRTNQGLDAAHLETIKIAPRSEGSVPNPVHYDFENQMALVGYQYAPRRLAAGQTITLTLYWQAVADMEQDYTVFTHLRDIDDPSNRIYAQEDALAPGGSSSWQPGETVTATYHLTLAHDTPAEVHEIEIGVYHTGSDGTITRLQLITPDGRLVDDFLILGKVRVD